MLDFDHTTNPQDREAHFSGFQNLMPHRIQNVLLVSSLYESFVIEEDGLVNELLISEYMNMNLTHTPKVTSVSTAPEALEYIKTQSVDLVITMTRLGTWDVSAFAREVKGIKPDLPIAALAGEQSELFRQAGLSEDENIDRIFVWNGDAKILLAIIKLTEDRLNVHHDTHLGQVRVILLVENSIRFYSAYLPLIYTELLKLTQNLMAEGINLTHRLLRMRARPKILLAETFEDAEALYEKFSEQLLGVISDIRFPRDGQLDPEAGLRLTYRIKAESDGLPVLLQSSDLSHKGRAEALHAAFVHKRSRSLLQELRNFLLENLGFGDFVFHLPGHTEVGRAHDLRSFEDMVHEIPDECLEYHGKRNHFSNWLMARTEFELASRIRPKKVTDFADIADARRYLLASLAENRERSQSRMIAEFSAKKFDVGTTFARIGGGSLGGKGRGLAFVRSLIRRHNLSQRFDGVRIYVPRSIVIGTDVYDAFMEKNDLYRLAGDEHEDEEIAKSFAKAKLPSHIHTDLKSFLREVRYPLAVRSSSMLEDSLDRPFAGIYATHMIPNNHADMKLRLRQLSAAIKLVYASTIFRSARRYLEATGHHSEEEKMAVVLQEIIGSAHGPRFYPTFSGVARSFNFYPSGVMRPDEGVACVALGLGKIVVEGGESLMFSPAHPNILPQFPTTKDWLKDSQRHFYALDVAHAHVFPTRQVDANLVDCDLEAAEEDGTLNAIGSVYSADNDKLYEGLNRPGTRLVSFARILKYQSIQLAEILKLLLEIGRQAMASPIEIEFAVDLGAPTARFGILQIRPIITQSEFQAVAIEERDREDSVCYSAQSMGNGRFDGIRDIVFVKPNDFDSSFTRQIAAEIATVNDDIRQRDAESILIGPGRWGSADRWLGIPVTWEQICTARAIVETTAPDFVVKPSQGTHFFQNLTSLQVGYFTINPIAGEGSIDWEWLNAQPVAIETRFLRHVHLAEPVVIKLDGRCRCGVIVKGNSRP